MPDADIFSRAVLDNRRPLAPIKTQVEPQLQSLGDVRAVVFDIYGTLVVSGSGDVGSANESDPSDQMGDAFAAIGVYPPVTEIPSFGTKLREIIVRMNQPRQSESCPKPEVDIVSVWRTMLIEVGLEDLADQTQQVVRLAAEYESRANPTWPMPGARQLLGRLRQSDLSLGIVSNAQQFTLSLVADLAETPESEAFDGQLTRVGFDRDLCYFSNRYRQSKPGPRMFDALNAALRRRSILPSEAVYVGNDMLNDVYAASVAGLKTAWFAGDVRSCRPRSDDDRCRQLRPDVVLTDLMQLLSCLSIE